MKITEIQPGAGFETHVKIIEISPMRKLWRCFECKKTGATKFSGVWKDQSEFKDCCSVCGAKESNKANTGLFVQNVVTAEVEDESGGILMDLWKEDATKYNVGDKLHLLNGFCKKDNKNQLVISKGMYGQIVKE